MIYSIVVDVKLRYKIHIVTFSSNLYGKYNLTDSKFYAKNMIE